MSASLQARVAGLVSGVDEFRQANNMASVPNTARDAWRAWGADIARQAESENIPERDRAERCLQLLAQRMAARRARVRAELWGAGHDLAGPSQQDG